MTYSHFKFAHLLYALAFLLALFIRLSAAGQVNLSASEAALALQALEIARGQSPVLSPYPAYLSLTALWMYLFSASAWVARFWPALAGSLMVFLPLVFRARLGKTPALLLAFFLALDPGLVAVSRQVDGPALALLFVPLAFGLWLNRRTALAGIAAGMALLSGPAVWPLLLSLGIAMWAVRRRQPYPDQSQPAPLTDAETQEHAAIYVTPETPQTAAAQLEGWRKSLIYALVTIFFIGTLFFTIPNGPSAMAASLPAYLGGWNFSGTAGGASLVMLIAALLLYELLPLLLGIWGAVFGLKNNSLVDRFFVIWWAAALVLALLYPARQVQDLTWSLLPIWCLAARQVYRLFIIPVFDRLPVLGQALLSTLIVGFGLITFAAVVNNPGGNMWEYQVRLIGAVVMLVASTGLIAWGWSRKVALRGMALGLGFLLVLYMISNAWNTAGLSGKTDREVWAASSSVKQGDLLLSTLRQLEQQGPSITGGPDLSVVNVTSPAMQWLLRGVRQITYTSQLPANASPALVITPDQSDLALSALYRGESFILDETIAWEQLKAGDWFRWLVYRQIPANIVQQTRVVLWARADFFPGGLQDASADQEQPAEITNPE